MNYILHVVWPPEFRFKIINFDEYREKVKKVSDKRLYCMELVELVDRCLYEDELRDILIGIGEEPEGAKQELIVKLIESKKNPEDVIRMIDEDLLTIVCLETGIPSALNKDQMVICILEDVIGAHHDYIEIVPKPEPVGVDGTDDQMEAVIDVSFDDVLSAVGDWMPTNVFLPRAVIKNELGQFLDEKEYPVQVGPEIDILVGNNVCIEMARGRVPDDIDGLVERMIRDLTKFQYAMGVMYGVESESVVDRLEEALDSFFKEPDRVAMVLI
jgi:hypothetical protein